MFGSIINSITSESYNVDNLATNTITFNRYNENRAILDEDGSIEERLAPSIEAKDNIDSVVIFGFADYILIVFHLKVAGITVEAVLLILNNSK